jgi:peptidyl-prolyl cis-trans isomerase A (cyclophilin A)
MRATKRPPKPRRLILLIALLALSCNKDGPKDTVPPDLLDGKTAETTEETTQAEAITNQGSEVPAQPLPDPYPGEVRAPLAEDLPHYLEGIEGEGDLLAMISTTMGDVNCKLFEKQAPITVANFVGLARGIKPFRDPASGKVSQRPYFDGIIFHRVIPNFMVQTGDPLGRGNGGPGYSFEDETVASLKHEPGTLSMANSGPDTNGSQFFITDTATSHLDGRHTVFGRCRDMKVIESIARTKADDSNRPLQTVSINGIVFSRGSL